MEHPRNQDQTIGEIRPPERNEEPDGCAVTAADEVRRPADDRLQKRDRVLRHRVEGDRTGYVRRVAVAATLRRVHVEPSGQRADVRAKRPRIDTGPSRVEQDDGIPLAVLVIPGADTSEGYIFSHGASPVVSASDTPYQTT
jgi:hypothetical protein